MPRKTIVGKYCTKEQEKLYLDISKAILIYYKDGSGEVLMDDFNIINSSKEDGWHKMSLYFKVKE